MEQQQPIRVQQVILMSKTEKPYQVPLRVAKLSELVKEMAMEDDVDEVSVIPLHEVDNEMLEKVLVFMHRHVDDPLREVERPVKTKNMVDLVGVWDAAYMDLTNEEIISLTLAADYLNCGMLLDLCVTKIAAMVKDLEADELRKMWDISPDITPEEEKFVRETNPWIFEVKK
jgi:S-phase kinase-associated protein 1